MAAAMDSTGSKMIRGFIPDKENLPSKMSSFGTPGRRPLKPVQENNTPTQINVMKKRLSSVTPSVHNEAKRKARSKRLSIPVHMFRRTIKQEHSRRSTGFVIAKDATIKEASLTQCVAHSKIMPQVERASDLTHINKNTSSSQLAECEKELENFSERVVAQVLTDITKGEKEKEDQRKLKEFADIILQMNKERLQLEQKLAHFKQLGQAMPKNLKATVKKADARIQQDVEKELAKKKSEIRQLKSELLKLQGDKKFKYIEKEIEGRKVEIKQLKVEINQLQHKLKEVPNLKTDLQKAKEQSKNMNDMVITCRKENNSQKLAITKLQKELSSKESRVRHHMEENEKQIAGLKKEVKEKESVIGELQEEVCQKEAIAQQCEHQCGEINRLVSRLEILTTMAETFKKSAVQKVQNLTHSLEEECKVSDTLKKELEESRSQSEKNSQESAKLAQHVEELQSQVDIGKLEISRQHGVIKETQEALEKGRVELCMYQEHLELVQCQQQEMNAFILEEKRSLEETAQEYEHELKIANKTKCILDMSLREKSFRCGELEEKIKYSRSLYQEKQEELDATQSQAHFIMLQQQAEMTEATEELNEAWEIMESLLDRFRQEARLLVKQGDGANAEQADISDDPPHPSQHSLVQSVLNAVAKTSEIPPENDSDDDVMVPSLKQQVSDLKQGLLRLVEIGSGQAANQEAQETIAQLEQSRDTMQKELNSQLNQMTSELETSRTSDASLRCELRMKSAEIDGLMLTLRNARERLEASQQEVSRRLDQQEELQLLRENVEQKTAAQRKLESEKECIAGQLADTLARLDHLTAGSDGAADVGRDMPSKLLQEKHDAELKLKQFKEKFMEYRMRTDDRMNEFKFRTNSNISVLQRNLQKAETEICRLDEILEKIRIILHKQSNVVSGCPELTKLLRFLDGDDGADQ